MLKNILDRFTYNPNVMSEITVIVIVVSIAVAAICSSFYAAELYDY